MTWHIDTIPFNAAQRAIYEAETTPSGTIRTGLLDIQAESDERGDRRLYSPFYSQGVWFWAEIDSTLRLTMSSQTDWDAFLPAILAADLDDVKSAPDRLLSIFPRETRERIAVSIDTYLG